MDTMGSSGGKNKSVNPNGSISCWLHPLREGDEVAAEMLWKQYFPRLVHLARERLSARTRQAVDEEDVALSAFKSFCLRAEQGQFPNLHDRDGLWRLLVEITLRKVIDQARWANRLKRGGGMTRLEAPADEVPLIDQMIGPEPSPAFAAEVAEEWCHLLELLNDSTLQQIAILRMEGHQAVEIAEQLDCSERSVRRKLSLIRKMWEKQATP